MTDIPYTRLGNSGLMVSRLVFGTMTFTLGHEFIPGVAKVGQADASAMVTKALDAGVNFFDTADGYAGGESEIILGRALAQRRNEALVCTKIGFRQSDRMTDAGLSRGHIMASIDGCLERLGMDHIDLLVVHKTDFTTPMEETLRALDDVVKLGKVRYLGCSNWPAWQVASAVQFQRDNGLAPFITGQYLYNAAARDIEVDVLPMAREMGLGLMAWSPLAGGLLTGKYDPQNLAEGEGRLTESNFLEIDPDTAQNLINTLRAVAKDNPVSPAQIAQAWILAKDPTHTLIFGASRMDHLDTTLEAAQIKLTPEEVQMIDDAVPQPRRYPEWFDTMMTDELHKKVLT